MLRRRVSCIGLRQCSHQVFPATKIEGIFDRLMEHELARTLLQNPDILLLDEPTSALDPASTRKIEQLIRTISESIPVILVTHNIGQARRMTSHVTVFCLEEQGGYVCESGLSQKILYKPDSLTVRNFFASETGDDSLWPFC